MLAAMMRWTPSLLCIAGLAGCEGDKKTPPMMPKDGETVPSDQSIDAPALPPCASPVSGTTVKTRTIGRVPGAALLATSPPNDPRLFVLQQSGVVRIFKDEILEEVPFIDLSVDANGPVTSDGNEMGLLGLAFHPRYGSNGLFFLYYTTGDVANASLRDVVVRCSVDAADPDRAQASSCTEILSIPDPMSNHNGGMMEFGADGLLYIGTGDGGGNQNLPRSQDPNLLLGKMLRVDVDTRAPGKNYGIPPTNPFASGGGAPEVFMLGLRNPWRWSFDRATGDMWIGDVGAATIEELTVLTPEQQRGANLGWSMYEGSRCFVAPCDPSGKVFPQDERERSSTGWTAIVAGQVYRGTCYPDLVGWHFYSDNGAGGLVKARRRADGSLEIVNLTGDFPRRPASIHADARGELFLTDVSGFVHRIEAQL